MPVCAKLLGCSARLWMWQGSSRPERCPRERHRQGLHRRTRAAIVHAMPVCAKLLGCSARLWLWQGSSRPERCPRERHRQGLHRRAAIVHAMPVCAKLLGCSARLWMWQGSSRPERCPRERHRQGLHRRTRAAIVHAMPVCAKLLGCSARLRPKTGHPARRVPDQQRRPISASISHQAVLIGCYNAPLYSRCTPCKRKLPLRHLTSACGNSHSRRNLR
jgi:hypothetical protein